jgi:co-chaperonin GroES (HSP10)
METLSNPDRSLLPKPQLLRLKDMGVEGARVLEVVGNRILVKTVRPWTDMDRLEKEGLLAIPETAKDRNTPLPSTGIVLQLGAELLDIKRTPRNFDADGRMIVQEGSMVMFSRLSGTDIGVGGESDLRILFLDDVYCTLTIPETGVLPVKS